MPHAALQPGPAGPAPGTTVSMPHLLTDLAFLGLSLLICKMGVRAGPASGAAPRPNQDHRGCPDVAGVQSGLRGGCSCF